MSEVGEMTEAQAIVGLGQVQEQVQTEIGSDVLSVESTTILLDEKIGRHNKYYRCLLR